MRDAPTVDGRYGARELRRLAARAARGVRARRHRAAVAVAAAGSMLATGFSSAVATAQGAGAVASPSNAELAARVADLEAYVTNGAPKTLISPGPGHNAWMMTSTALVLFMTLPGLALFYGGLVRRKKRAVGHGAVPRLRGVRHHLVVAGRLTRSRSTRARRSSAG